jgi:hypothetical protein
MSEASLSAAERQRRRRAKLKEQGLSVRGRPLNKPRKPKPKMSRQKKLLRELHRELQLERDAIALLKAVGYTEKRALDVRRDASANLTKRTSNWRILKI